MGWFAKPSDSVRDCSSILLFSALRLLDNRQKDVNTIALGCQNLPGLENRFDGDDQL